ncbi:Putative gamma-glutamyltransferase YwrD [Luteitalea pratensis]|uniref:Gamma-glutamyltransferase YwrD n=1 Tax=Luteitalea pratensis TaxID=1855912 RepID=A0A143PGK6_LUTPR|nr:gamma-glutamyltransferase family protein [Luteitalea pratensis]AMY07188.1 Putative gamma-glutamyltransferase YwrD [Luteitalea pratensis]
MSRVRSRGMRPSRRVAVASVVLSIGTWYATGSAQSPIAFGTPTTQVPQPGGTVHAVPGSRAQGWLAQGRSEVLARHGIVATSDPLAAQAGVEILRKGGNAIDAAVAAAAVLDVTSQNDTGIGGDLFAIVYVAHERKLYALNSAGWAPAGWTPQFFTDTLGLKAVPASGVNAATVPGAISGYDALLGRFGTMTFAETFARAARIAEEGWGQAERRHGDLLRVVAQLRADPDSTATFLQAGQAPDLYRIIRNPGLAKALRLIQKDGRDAFYRGDIASAIVAKIRAGGGVMSASDLAEFRSEWTEPIATSYHGYDVFQLPPPGQGFAALEMLNILEVCVPKLGMNLAELGPSSPMYWHLMVEAKKLAYADLHAYNADPAFADVPVARLISKSHAAELCGRIDVNRASGTAASTGVDGGTIYLSAADRWGNMVSLVHSVFSVYGSRATVPPYGFVLQNRGAAFSLNPKSPNLVAPHKRPFHTIIAGFVMKDGQPLMAFGNMGGTVQPETHAQHMVNMIDHGMNVQMTSDAARFTHAHATNVLSLEPQLFALVGAALRRKGHVVQSAPGNAVGGYQGILFTPDGTMPGPTFDKRWADEDRPVNGVYRAGSDHRKDGQAVGW